MNSHNREIEQPEQEEEPILISAISHYAYCPRRSALVHVEHIFDENVFTLRGRNAHERVDDSGFQQRGKVRVERALPLWSDSWGLLGKADAVEFWDDGRIVPVEYKIGGDPEVKSRTSSRIMGIRPEDLQLCAQAVCLEEMFECEVSHGAIYHISSHARRDVMLVGEIRVELKRIVNGIRGDIREGVTPPPVNDARCPKCSLADACVPAVIAEARMNWHLKSLYRLDEEE